MIRSLYTAVSGMITQEAKQDVITNNLANANTVGFKADNLSIKSFNDVLLQNYDKIVGGRPTRNVLGTISEGSEINGVRTEFTQGTVQDTGKDTDFAIDGGGFFTVARNSSNGTSQFYTRDGHFHVNNAGYLVNDSGDSVLVRDVDNNSNPTGASKPLFVGNGKLECDSQGNITVNNNKYKLQIADFANYDSLKKVGDNLYEGSNPINNPNASVKQGSLEKSNINVINEMANMITVMRSFESNQKVVQSIDETLGKAVNDVGTVR